MPFPNENKKVVPRHLERVTNQTATRANGWHDRRRRVTNEHTITKDRNCRGFLPAQNSSKNQVAGPMVGQAGFSSRKSRCGGSNGSRGNHTESGRADAMNADARNLGDLFGTPVSVYSRRQAIEDGVLVDLMQPDTVGLVREAGFKFPIAMTAAAFAATVAEIDKPLPAGQDIQGRLWDVLWMLSCAIKRADHTDRVRFRVSVWDSRRRQEVKLWSLCGPGDDAAPVITIMLEGED